MYRKLLEAGFEDSRPLHCYRGDGLAMRISSIGWGAKYTVEDNPYGTPVLRRYRGKGMVAAPPIAPEAEVDAEVEIDSNEP
jgi:hypothetical protein